MNLDQAIYLTKAWCAEAREPFDKAKVSPNGDFRGVFGAAEIVYSAQTKKLSVQGLIIDDASLLIKHAEFFNEIKRAGDRESYTLGEGYFFIDRESQDTNTPQLTLRKDFADGSTKPKQFVLEVDWLMRWSTYWRLQRSNAVGTKSEEELIREAPSIEAWAKKNSPRPW